MKPRVAPKLIRHRDIARDLGIRADQISRWIGERIWPPPHSEFNRTKFFRAEHYAAYMASGEWPAAAWPKKGE